MKKRSRIEVFPAGSKDDWCWHIRASNGRITANNETFPTRANALRAAKALVKAVLGNVGVASATFQQAPRPPRSDMSFDTIFYVWD